MRQWYHCLLLLAFSIISLLNAGPIKDTTASKSQAIYHAEEYFFTFQNDNFSKYYLQNVQLTAPAMPESAAGPFYQTFTEIASDIKIPGDFYETTLLFKVKTVRFHTLSYLLFPFHSFT